MIFPGKAKVLEYHALQIEAFGGSHGLRDEGALESALMAAQNRYDYEGADLATCAATYAFHLCKAHAFIDGNKRVAAVVAELVVEINQAMLNATDDEMEALILGIADSRIIREEVEQRFAQWITPLA
ncbi:MAG: type II toxin-antitoxin system death-on-curing family toxin [Acidobacteria bacterium]|nr:type II toxin-antitoxin system death-on-curing family toxin [Acidobacteriota bacterium]